MDEAAEWRALAARFSEMIPDMQRRYGGPLSAQWLPPEASQGQDQWKLIGIGIGYPPAHSPFKAAAERAAVLLGEPDGPSSLFFWLDLLKSESPHYEISPLSYKNAEGVMVHGEGGLITNLCLASAEHCYKLETRAIAKERTEWRPIPGSEPRTSSLELGNREMMQAQIRAKTEIEYERKPRELRTTEQNQKEQPTSETGESESPIKIGRSRGTIKSWIAVKRMDDYRAAKGLGQTEFASFAGTTDRTLRSFLKTGKVRRDIFDGIARAMGITREQLLKPDESGN